MNAIVSANMLRSMFYVCPICGNVIHSMGEAVVNCHGVLLSPQEAEPTDEKHKIFVERVEDEYYVSIEHDMAKTHYISFIAALSVDRLQTVKLYPEGSAEAKFKMSGVKKVFFYCNKDGLFEHEIIRGIDDRDRSHDDTEKRQALEEEAKRLFR